MTRDELNDLLRQYADAVYWYGEESGQYGHPDPEIHKEIEEKIWAAISNSTMDKLDIFITELEKDLLNKYKGCEDFAATPCTILLAVLNAVVHAKRAAQSAS